jgi:hypothetical protein
MTYFMRDDVFYSRANESFRPGTRRLVSARREQVHRELQLAGGVLSVLQKRPLRISPHSVPEEALAGEAAHDARPVVLDLDVGVEDLAAARIDCVRPIASAPSDRLTTQRTDAWRASPVSKSSRAAVQPGSASLKPIFSNRLVHSRIRLSRRRDTSRGCCDRASTIGCFSSLRAADGSFFSSRQRST